MNLTPVSPSFTDARIHGPRVGAAAVAVGDQTADLPYCPAHQALRHPVRCAAQWVERTVAFVAGDRPYW